MTFAQRVINLEPEGAYAVLARAQALEAQGREIIHMEIGQPDFQTYPNISLAGVKAITEGYTRYNPAAGYPQLRQAIARDAGERRGLEIRPSQVVVGPGGKPGLFFTAMALIEPGAGDEVLYPNPGYSTHWAMIDISGGKAVPVPLVEEKGFSFDLEAFDALVNERTKIVVINSPANPTGGVIPLKDLEHIAEAAHKYNFWVISDEIYSRLVFDGQHAPSIATLPGMQERTIIVDGFSKTYAMTGWRLGYAIMPEALASRVELLLNHAIGCTASFTQMAGLEALNGPQDAVDHVLAAYQARRDRIVAGLNAIPGVSCQTPQGAFYAFPNVKSFGVPSKQLADRILNEVGVSLLSGTDFGKYGEGYLRLSFATSMNVINQGLERLAGFFARF